MNYDPINGRTFASILAETRDDLKQFLETRIALLRAELREKLKVITRTAPLAAAALVLLGTAYLLFTLSLVGLVLALMPGNPFRWCLAFLAVAVLWMIAGVVAAAMAKRRFSMRELAPNRTIGVLKNDGVWIQSEVKNQI
jgi:uncharacterized membrane protein YqjE